LAAVFLLGIGLGGLSTEEPMSSSAVAQGDELVPVRLVFYDRSATRVAVAGSWNGWDITATPLQAGGGGAFFTTIALPSGEHEYMFVVDGERWVADPTATLTRDDGFGQLNAVLQI